MANRWPAFPDAQVIAPPTNLLIVRTGRKRANYAGEISGCQNAPKRIGLLKGQVTLMLAELKECYHLMEATDEDPKEMLRIVQRAFDLRRQVWEAERRIEDVEFQYLARN